MQIRNILLMILRQVILVVTCLVIILEVSIIYLIIRSASRRATTCRLSIRLVDVSSGEIGVGELCKSEDVCLLSSIKFGINNRRSTSCWSYQCQAHHSMQGKFRMLPATKKLLWSLCTPACYVQISNQHDQQKVGQVQKTRDPQRVSIADSTQ